MTKFNYQVQVTLRQLYGLCEDEYVFIEPLGSKHIVKLDMLRIARNDLKELIHKVQTGARSILDPPRHEVAAAIPKKTRSSGSTT